MRPDGRTDRETETRTDMTKLILFPRNYATTPKKELVLRRIIITL